MVGTLKTLQKTYVALAGLALFVLVGGGWATQASALGITDAIYFGGTPYFELADVAGKGLDFTPLETSMENVFGSFDATQSNPAAIGGRFLGNFGKEDWTFTNTSDSALYDVQFLVTYVYVDEGTKGAFGDVGIAGDDLYIVPIAGVYVAAFDLGDVASGATSSPVTLKYHAPKGFSAGINTDYALPMTGYGLFANATGGDPRDGENPIPEPSAALLFGAGFLSLMISRRGKCLGV